ncbi:MAG: alpha/beta hydrolase [Actinomycetota bacterium]
MSTSEAPNPSAAARSLTVETANGPVACSIWDAAGEGAGRAAAVLIHGVNGSVASWAGVVAAVAGRRPLVAIDLRGRGASPAKGPWGVEAHGTDVAEVVGALGEASGSPLPVTLVGHSFGAHVAAAAAGQAPGLVAELVLVDGGPPRRVPAEGGAKAAIDGALGNILPMLDDLPFPVSAEAVAADFASMVNDGSADDVAGCPLAATTQPLTLIRAGNGMAPGLPPIIDDDLLADLTTARGGPVTSELVPAATHFSLLGDHSGPVVEAIATLRS